MITLSDLRLAQKRLEGVTIHTKLVEFKLCAEDPRRLLLKPENQQPIGAFKLRGAYNKIASLSDDERRKGVISTPAATTPRVSPTPPAPSKQNL